MTRYPGQFKIYRVYKSGYKKLLKVVSSKEIAVLHCNDPRTKKVDRKGNIVWMDVWSYG